MRASFAEIEITAEPKTSSVLEGTSDASELIDPYDGL